jgi:hypothetical protein
MKAHWVFLIFVAGLGAGWLIPHGSSHESAVTGNKPTPPVVRKHEARPEKTAHPSEWRTFAKELPKLSEKEKDAFKQSLAPADRAAALEAMLGQIGPDGFPWQAKAMIEYILKSWAGEDFDGAWAWCQQIESDATRKFVAGKLLEQLVDKDPDRALALHLEMAAVGSEFSSSFTINILKKAAAKDAGSFLDLLGKLPFGNSCSGDTMVFAENFNFQQAADGLTALTKNQSGKRPPVFPYNFLGSWAARDADAAYAWLSKHPNVVPYGDFGSLLLGIEMKGTPGASAAWAADKINEPGAPREELIREFTCIDAFRQAADIGAIAQAMPDTASRDRFLGDAITLSFVDDPVGHFGYVFTLMSSPAARLDALRRLAEKDKLDAAKIPDTQLQTWGLTRQQVEQVARH